MFAVNRLLTSPLPPRCVSHARRNSQTTVLAVVQAGFNPWRSWQRDVVALDGRPTPTHPLGASDLRHFNAKWVVAAKTALAVVLVFGRMGGGVFYAVAAVGGGLLLLRAQWLYPTYALADTATPMSTPDTMEKLRGHTPNAAMLSAYAGVAVMYIYQVVCCAGGSCGGAWWADERGVRCLLLSSPHCT